MSSFERVIAACEFRAPDRVPRFDSFWSYPDSWRAVLGPPEDLNDIDIWYADETPFPSRARGIKEDSGWIYEVDGWGRTIRRRPDAYFHETLEVAIPDGTDPDSVTFDPPSLDSRYLYGRSSADERDSALARAKEDYCVFAKIGGPYLRTTFVRGEEQFLMDIAADPELARALADKVGDHLAAVGVEQIGRLGVRGSGIWIYDDMACNRGPMFSAASFEKVFIPVYRRIITACKDAGARYVFLHSDGDIRPILDMLIEAGIDGLNPLERRAGMDILTIRKLYPSLILTGGMCNTDTLLNGPADRVEREAREIIEVGREGGLVIGTHSISPEIPLEYFAAYDRACRGYGDFGVPPDVTLDSY